MVRINFSLPLENCYKRSSAILSGISIFKGALAKLKTQHQEDPSSPTLATNKPTLLRSLFTVGALCRHFDFDQEEFKGANKVKSVPYLKSSRSAVQPLITHLIIYHVFQIVIKDKVLELLLYFTTHEDEEVQLKAIIGLGKFHADLWSKGKFLK